MRLRATSGNGAIRRLDERDRSACSERTAADDSLLIRHNPTTGELALFGHAIYVVLIDAVDLRH